VNLAESILSKYSRRQGGRIERRTPSARYPGPTEDGMFPFASYVFIAN
jgi:hypothetical protein